MFLERFVSTVLLGGFVALSALGCATEVDEEEEAAEVDGAAFSAGGGDRDAEIPRVQHAETGEDVNVVLGFVARQLGAHLRDRSLRVRLTWSRSLRRDDRPIGLATYRLAPFTIQLTRNGQVVATCRDANLFQESAAQLRDTEDRALDTAMSCGFSPNADDAVLQRHFANGPMGNYFRKPFQDYGH